MMKLKTKKILTYVFAGVAGLFIVLGLVLLFAVGNASAINVLDPNIVASEQAGIASGAFLLAVGVGFAITTLVLGMNLLYTVKAVEKRTKELQVSNLDGFVKKFPKVNVDKLFDKTNKQVTADYINTANGYINSVISGNKIDNVNAINDVDVEEVIEKPEVVKVEEVHQEFDQKPVPPPPPAPKMN